MAQFTLQLLHFSDQEAGIPALKDAPNLSAVLKALKDQDGDDVDTDPDYLNTLILSSGDAYIPGTFLDASVQAYGGQGRADILIQNELGVQAISFGNHEFDLGTGLIANLLKPSADGLYAGAAFPYLSGNLNFAPDANLAPLVTADGQEASTIAGKIAASSIITVNGEKIGVVGATTPILRSISSPGAVQIEPSPFGSVPSAQELDALAAIIQADVDALLANNPDLNKVILLSHMQQISIEQEIAKRLRNVDIIVAGGSNTRLLDSNDVLRAGDTKQGEYPFFTNDADGKPIAVVNTDGNYKYVGRLVIDFDENGNVIAESYDPNVSGVYATDDTGVAALNAQNLVDPEIQQIVDNLSSVISSLDGAIFGSTDVFLNGARSDIRIQETNLGNLTADANLAYAKTIDSTVTLSLKNGGGVRNNIGFVTFPEGSTDPDDVLKLPPAANPLAGKEEGDISQLDITNSLSFNNGLALITLTAEELLEIVEYGFAASSLNDGNTQGRFPQIGGFSVAVDLTRAPGDRVLSLAIKDEEGRDIDVVVRNGEIVGNPARTFRMVTLSFLADGGDGYPFPTGEATNRIDLAQPAEAERTGLAQFAPDGTEQDVLAEYLATRFTENSFDKLDSARDFDTRIQNVSFRDDTVINSQIQLSVLGTFATGSFDQGAAEIPAYDPISQRLFVVNAQNSRVDVLDISDPTRPTLIGFIDTSSFGSPNSVAIQNGLVAIAVQNANPQENGQVFFYQSTASSFNAPLRAIEVGALPDMLIFTPDGSKVLVANEGEPNEDYTVDPEGSVSIIDLSLGVANAQVRTATFTAFNDRKAELQEAGVRILKDDATVAEDVEPEYIAISPDGNTAVVTLQEANALAFIDLATATVTDIKPLGLKDFSLPGNALDPSDRDGGINLRNVPVFGLYQPDAIASFVGADGKTYYITANEGDSRVRPTGDDIIPEVGEGDIFNEEVRVSSNRYILDPTIFPNAAELKQNSNLGRLTVTNESGDLDGDGDFDQIVTFGARSFSILNSEGELVFDSGDQLERITASFFPENFNASNDNNDLDNRSDNKGPEPEGVVIGQINDRTYAFVGLERTGGVIVYDVTTPNNPTFVQYLNNRNFNADVESAEAGDLGPEGLAFISAEDSPNGKPLLVVANEISGTTTLYEINVGSNPDLIKLDNSAQIAYITYLGRPGDRGGLTFWNEVLRDAEISYDPQTGDLITGEEVLPFNAFINGFGDSSEADQIYGGKSAADQVNLIYNFAFNRNAESAGQAFWVNQLNSRQLSLAELALEIGLNATGNDSVVLNNKIRSATLFTDSIDTNVELAAYQGSKGTSFGQTWLDQFDFSQSSQALVDSALNALVNDLPLG
ncbi:choice-of-anchor I family protein [Synechococcus elongatus]|uniref:choice-of-anchor I family protein n=1 Tax=Synechococcus elongatus TaxID=32046 RepID=UPI000F7DE5D6|nr:choice-of-anchor I family protein [Synechococcus elongatus]